MTSALLSSSNSQLFNTTQLYDTQPQLPSMFLGGSSRSVSVCVDGVPFQYQLTEDDLSKVFSRYGTVLKVIVINEGSSANITFSQTSEAEHAARDLNGKVLNGVKGCLKVSLSPDTNNNYNNMMMSNNNNTISPQMAAAQLLTAATSNQNSPWMMGSNFGGSFIESPNSFRQGTFPGSAIRKYTCRFDIAISNDDKDFHVARRIIGQKGTNMKRIITSFNDVKLRLRGRGSGFLEGEQKLESMEPLHLCVSCRDFQAYMCVIDQVKCLLEGIYQEYREYCLQTNQLVPEDLQVSYREHPLVTSNSSANLGHPTIDDPNIYMSFSNSNPNSNLTSPSTLLPSLFPSSNMTVGNNSNSNSNITNTNTSNNVVVGSSNTVVGSSNASGSDMNTSMSHVGLSTSAVPFVPSASSSNLIVENEPTKETKNEDNTESQQQQQSGLTIAATILNQINQQQQIQPNETNNNNSIINSNNNNSLSSNNNNNQQQQVQQQNMNTDNNNTNMEFRPLHHSGLGDLVPPPGAPTPEEIERMIEARNEARKVCNFKEADRLRDFLRSQGVGLMDEPGARGKGTEVTTWRYWKSRC